MKKSQRRSSNIELLRILAMLLIVASHYTVHGLNGYEQNLFSLNHYDVLRLGGGIGVNCFVLASGYFMVNSCVSMPKIARIVFQTVFYSFIFSLIAVSIGDSYFDASWKDVIRYGFGIQGGYWFINAYLGLILLVPFLNKLAKTMAQREHLVCILTLVLLACVLPEYARIPTYFNQLGWFVEIYMIAAYIRLYGVGKLTNRKLYACLVLVTLLTVIGVYCAPIMASCFKAEFLYWRIRHYVVCSVSLPILIISVLLFTWCLRWKLNNSYIINYLASCTLGVYLFHEHPLWRDFIWQKCLHTREAPLGDWPLLHCLVSIVAVYVAGTLVDIVWRHTLAHLYAPLERYILMPVYTRIKKCGCKVLGRIEN